MPGRSASESPLCVYRSRLNTISTAEVQQRWSGPPLLFSIPVRHPLQQMTFLDGWGGIPQSHAAPCITVCSHFQPENGRIPNGSAMRAGNPFPKWRKKSLPFPSYEEILHHLVSWEEVGGWFVHSWTTKSWRAVAFFGQATARRSPDTVRRIATHDSAILLYFDSPHSSFQSSSLLLCCSRCPCDC